MNGDLVYLDNSAASRMDEKVLEAMKPYLLDIYAVATSEFAYSLGIEAKEALEKARENVASRLGASAEELIFTSGGTESSNLAIKGTVEEKDEGSHVITSKIEDFPVLKSNWKVFPLTIAGLSPSSVSGLEIASELLLSSLCSATDPSLTTLS